MKLAAINDCEEACDGLESWKTDLYEDIVRMNKRHRSFGSNSHKRRLDFILDCLSSETSPLCQGCSCSNPLLVNPDAPSKCAKVSIKYRNMGNDFFKKNQLEKAFEAYTRSLAYAPFGSEEFALAAGNRSTIFFKTKLFFDCLEDINSALRANYPDNLKAKLYHRKACCQQALQSSKDQSAIKKTLAKARHWAGKMSQEKQKSMLESINNKDLLNSYENATCHKWGYQDIVPEIKSENSIIPGLSDAVEMKYSEKYGRHMVATRDIKPGEFVGVQKPYARVTELKLRFKFCWHCNKQTWSSVPCNTCGEVVYCSTNCRDNSRQEYHDIECELLRQLFAYGGPLRTREAYLMPLRLTIMAYKEAGCSLDSLKQMIEKIEAVPELKKKGFFDEKQLGSKFSTVHCMATHFSEDINIHSVFVTNAILMAFCFSIKIGLHTAGKDMLTDLYVMVDDKFRFLVDFIMKNTWNMIYNSHDIQLSVKHSEDVTIARIIAPTFGYFNHSCVAKLTYANYNYGEYFATPCIAPIKKGEQVFVNYGTDFPCQDSSERYEYLDKYDFDCDCEACLYNLDGISVDELEISPAKLKAVNTFVGESAKSALKVMQLADSASNYCKIHNQAMDVSTILDDNIKFVEKAWTLFERKNAFPLIDAVKTLQHTFCLTRKNILYLK